MVFRPLIRAGEPLEDVTVSDELGHSAPNQTTEERIRQAMPLVGYVVTELLARLPAHVRREDLESAGYEALVRCARSYDESVGTTFAQYARIRVRGAVVDELRSADWASRGTRRAERALSGAEERLTQQLGRHPSGAEVAAEVSAEIGGDGSEMMRTRERVQRAAVLSLNAVVGDNDVDLATGLASTEVGHEERIVAEERTQTLYAAVEALPERLRIVIEGYFLGERPMAEIARELGVSESRISQMRAQALELLREGMTRALDDHDPTDPYEVSAAAARLPDAAQVAAAGIAARRREEYYARVAALAGTTGRRDSVTARSFAESSAPAAPAAPVGPGQHPSYLSALA